MVLIGVSIMPDQIRPANYYEKKIPTIVDYVQMKGNQLLSPQAQKELESIIPLEGIDYQVVDVTGRIIYGSIQERFINNTKDLYSKINTDIHKNGRIIKMYPLFEPNDQLSGAIFLQYQLSVTSTDVGSKWIISMVLLLTLSSPFIYFYLFSYLFGRRFSKKLERPFYQLIDGAKSIQHNNLDFSLPVIQESHELNQLVQAFEEMRVALKKSLVRQWELEEERKEMVAAIAHDLRTPLTIIHGHAEGLIEGSKKDQDRLDRYLHTIFTNTQRSIRLLDQLHGVSLVEIPGFQIQPEWVDIKTFLDRKVQEFELLCKKKEIDFLYTVDQHSDIEQIYMDDDRISQVLDNIITNAIRYTPEKGQIKWHTMITQENVIFEIKDSGPGFGSTNYERLFRKFYREDSSRTGKEGHVGLGLFIAQSIVHKHGGNIEAFNSEEGGATMKVAIPIDVNSDKKS